MADWYVLSAAEVLTHLGSRTVGLTQEEAGRRLAEVGPNRLAAGKRTPPWMIFLRQFNSLLILALMGAAGLAWVVGDLKDALVILGVGLLNATLGFAQEYKAEQALDALKNMLALKARVRRNEQVVEVDAEELVPGDVVLLEAGDKVPADGRLLAANTLEVDESTLTGESSPVAKITEELPITDLPLAERVNLVFMNTVVTRGNGETVVTATGMKTEMGRLAGLIQTTEEGSTPLQIQLDQLGKRLSAIAGGVVALAFTLGLLRGMGLFEIVMTSIALAVAAIPEGLPTVVTVTLSMGMYRMARHRAIIKRLLAVETLGCTTVICSDKIGTLTLNRMTAQSVFFKHRRFSVANGSSPTLGAELANEGAVPPDFSQLLLPAVLCNNSRLQDGEVIGDPMEGALLMMAAKGGVRPEEAALSFPRIGEVPFDSANKYMATFYRDGEVVRIYVKGAPDVLMTRCRAVLGDEREEPLDAVAKDLLLQENEAMGARALRVLAFAAKSVSAEVFVAAGNHLDAFVHDLTLVGLVGMIDPPRPEAREMISLCKQAGIQVKMVTGDHWATAAAIGRELGLAGRALSGVDLDRLSAQALAEQIDEVSIFARVTPEHKVKIVHALKRRGHVVAMTGDGVNDAPALKQADIGVAMGKGGTEVAKEAADMVLTDDNFATIVRAVQEGRTIYDNIIKFVSFQLSTNIGALLTVFVAPMLGLPLPLNPVQILWVNIIMDGPPALALGLDPARPGIMADPPRRTDARILTSGRLSRFLFYGLIMTLGTLGILAYRLHAGEPDLALTLAFTTFVLYQCFNVFNARAEYGSALVNGLFSNWRLWLALVVVTGLQVVIVHLPFAQGIFGTVSLSLADWALAGGVALSILLLEEMRKLMVRLRRTSPFVPRARPVKGAV